MEYSAEQLVEQALHYREYFGEEGGVTLSGGEPLLQPRFASEIFSLCHRHGLNTCLDTSGSLLNEEVKEVLTHTDRVLLDVKYTEDSLYRTHVGCGLDQVLAFLSYLNEKQIPTTLRQVIIPTLNDTPENIRALNAIVLAHPCVDGVELLPFRKICQVKYDRMGIDFPFAHIPQPQGETMKVLEDLLEKKI